MAEVAGLILGVVPIILEALKQYDTLHESCKKFKRCKNGIEELIHCLQTQKVIFVNETRLLLSSSIDFETARSMVKDLEHPAWQNPSLIDAVDKFLGDSRDAIFMTGEDIQRKMKHFEDELDKFDFHSRSKSSTLDSAWRKEVRKRFKYTFSESRLQELGRSLAQLTKRYRTLRSQVQELAIVKSDRSRSRQTTTTMVTAMTRVEAIDRLTTTQAAAKRIYEILATACNLHTKHRARFSLKPEYNLYGATVEISFQMAYHHLSRQQVPGSSDILWFIVQSVFNGTITKRVRPSSLYPIQATWVTRKEPVRTPMPSLPSSSAATSSTPPSLTDVPNLGARTDFCTQLRVCCSKANSATGVCIGWLENSSRWQHRLIQCNNPVTQIDPQAVETLANLLASASKSPQASHGLPLLQRLRLAKLLTSACLNFASTPWMHSNWTSQDILLYGTHMIHNTIAQREVDAFVEVPVDQQISHSLSQDSAAASTLIRNRTLFNLAIMLLELAFEKPLQEMIENSDARSGLSTDTIDYHTALRLSSEVSTHLGIRYSRIVEQCLFCNFGQGTDLCDPKLQNAVHRDVLSELDRLTTGFESLLIT